mgnify:CR=1 FL=1
MKRFFDPISLVIFTIILVTGISGCGSEINSNNTDKKIKITIPFDLSEKSFKKTNQTTDSNSLYGPAPSNVRSIRVDAVYRDGRKIPSTIDVAGGTYVEVNMEVDAGDYVFFKAFAYDGTGGTGNLLYLGASSPQPLLMGMYYDIIIQMSDYSATPPAITSVTPANGSTGVPTSSILTVIFSKQMDHSTINDSTATTSPYIGCYGSGGSGTTATCTPSPILSPNTTYTITFTTGVKDLAGNTMASSYTWSFTTGTDGGGGGTSLPSAFSYSLPLNGSTGVSLTPTLSWADSVGETSYKIEIATDPGFTAIIDTATVGTDIINYTVPAGKLSSSTTYYWRVIAVNSYGTTTISNAPFAFTTGAAPVTTVTLSSSSPSNGAAGVSVGTNVLRFTFSAPMATNFYTTGNYGPVSSNSWANSQTFEVYLSGTLPANTLITVTLRGTASGGFRGANGETFNDTTITFTTGASSDTTPPTVSSHTPVSGATGVPITSIITIIFSEAMDPTSLTTSTIILSPNPGYSISYSGTTATVTPTASLSAGTTYTVTIKPVKDAAGNAMTSDYTWSFTTSP